MAKKATRYFTIIKEETELAFLEKVNAELAEGWELVNINIQSNGSGDRWIWFAFLVK